MTSSPLDRETDALIAGLPLPEITESLRGWLPACRWFADKDRGTPSLSIADLGAIRRGADHLLMLFVKASFQSGNEAVYFVPLMLNASQESPGESPLFSIDVNGSTLHAWDAIGAGFGPWLLEFLSDHGELSTTHGVISGSALTSLSPSVLGEPCKASSAEQSNSSIHYQTLIAKVYRKLHAGINPDVEVGRHFLQSATFDSVPPLIGSLDYRSDDRQYTLAMVQERIVNPRDGWELLLESLQNDSPLAQAIGADLGELTARMHVALASPSDNPDFAPEPATEEVIAGWEGQTESRIDAIREALKEAMPGLDTATGSLAQRFVDQAEPLRTDLAGYHALTGYPVIRVHGDYHLGQILFSGDEQWYAVDFEGEPRRPIDERVRKTSLLKDVAGMLRSFSYARATVSRQMSDTTRNDLEEWEESTRADFITAWMRTVRAQRPDLLPSDTSAIMGAIRAWELDKALYEVDYEMASRPDWLSIPLSSIVERR